MNTTQDKNKTSCVAKAMQDTKGESTSKLACERSSEASQKLPVWEQHRRRIAEADAKMPAEMLGVMHDKGKASQKSPEYMKPTGKPVSVSQFQRQYDAHNKPAQGEHSALPNAIVYIEGGVVQDVDDNGQSNEH